MDVVGDLSRASLRQETILTIGAFDGVHRGHQILIKGIVERARATDRLAAVVTFHPHPVMVLAPQHAPRYLTTPGEKIALLEGLGVDVTILLSFSRELAALSAGEFMAQIVAHLRLRELWVGPDFALGRNREGGIPRLRELGDELGYTVHVVAPQEHGQEIISSSRIRDLLAQGQVADAARLLGRYPSLSGQVVGGARRGRQLGFPTANLEVRAERATPANGVYAVFAVLGQERYPAVANVGVRPSFDNGERTVETHIFDFDQDIYGCDLVVEFVARLRDERRFANIDELVAQIERDSRAARQILDRPSDVAPAAAEPGTPGGEEALAAARPEPRPAVCRYRYWEVEHTADRALRVWGEELADLFVGAARGLAGMMADVDGLVAVDWREIHLEAWDRESLLVDWLNELLYLAESEGLVLFEFQVDTLTDTALTVRVGGGRLPDRRESVKAATYHDLELVRDETGWSTVVTLDV